MFKEVQRHRPSIVYIPNINVWYDTVDSVVKRTFSNLLRSIPPNDPVLLVGWMETSKDGEKPSSELIKEFFGYTANSHYELKRPDQAAREAFFAPLTMYLRMKPTEFPDMENRKRRKFPDLDFAPEPEKVDAVPTKEELKEQRKRDRHALNVLKVLIQPIMDHIKVKHRKFRTPVIDEKMIQYLYDDMDPNIVSTNLGLEERQQQQTNRPYEISQDSKGVPGLLEVASQKFYYNLDTVIIEKRLSNGYYKRPKDFLFDIKRLVIDASTAEDSDRAIRASELLSTVEVDLTMIQTHNPTLGAECEALYRREKERERAKIGEVMRERIKDGKPMELKTNMPIGNSTTTEESSGPIVLGMPALNTHLPPPLSPTRIRGPSQLSNGYMAGDEHDSNQRQSNGSTVPSRIDVDVAMPEAMDVPLSAVPAFYRPKLASGMTNSQSQTLTHTHTQRSQKSAITPIVQGSQVADYHNSASTTTSDRKTSDHSNQSSGNTNLTNGASRSNLPDFSTMFPGSGASELPDTQSKRNDRQERCYWRFVHDRCDNG